MKIKITQNSSKQGENSIIKVTESFNLKDKHRKKFKIEFKMIKKNTYLSSKKEIAKLSKSKKYNCKHDSKSHDISSTLWKEKMIIFQS